MMGAAGAAGGDLGLSCIILCRDLPLPPASLAVEDSLGSASLAGL